jgi:hypothetical protein
LDEDENENMVHCTKQMRQNSELTPLVSKDTFSYIGDSVIIYTMAAVPVTGTGQHEQELVSTWVLATLYM